MQLDTPLLVVEALLDTTTSRGRHPHPNLPLQCRGSFRYARTPGHRRNDFRPWRVPDLSSSTRKYDFLSNARLPTHNANKPAFPDSRFELDRALTDPRAESIPSTADKFTYKWPQLRSSRSIPPGLRANHFSTRRMRELKGAGVWSPRQHGGKLSANAKA